ncbi:Cytochrome b5-like Heme/Steroid binding domain [Seminavis robusta]|uniref:Cytochrome b5-like Heme/Steroid binding domain n=1 Tax=Seminavis robusta TaxID=568900 RepID=A0A9N8E5B6_9STRA|nr:Cytochrome b5-like Heme/Steroid binding domain [Seminavis robusta]|eukprot:Sro634_g178960.1 Cytochrome b5-like Heme/Steroid binding domain (410) ;mRNA; f:15313-16542
MIRLGTLRSAGRELRRFCRSLVPLAVALTAYSRWCSWSGTHCLALILGWQVLRRYNQQQESSPSNTKACRIDDAPAAVATTRSVTHRRPLDSRCECYLTTDKIPVAVLSSICSYLHPRDVTPLACLNRAAKEQFTCHTLWNELWYRDYGRVLLQWNVARDVLQKSLHCDTELEFRLAQHLHSTRHSTRDFYFVFGETYVNYLLAGHNTRDNCYLGLHSHIVDFAQFAHYHPGMIDPVLLECGKDATEYFEGLTHSRGARAVARQLVVVVNKACCDYGRDNVNNNNNNQQYGLELRAPPSQLHQLLRQSNSRPLQESESNNNNKNSNNNKKKKQSLQHILPTKPHSKLRRPPTLQRIRTAWDQAKQKQEQQRYHYNMDNLAQWLGNDCWRVYYDPIRQEWIEWNAAAKKE